MELRLPQTHIYALSPLLDFESAKQQAFDKRVGVVAGGLGGLLSRPKPDDVELVYDEVRLESFWHIACTVRYVFERNRTFSVPIAGTEVRSVTLLGQEFDVAVQQPQQPPAGQPALFQQISQQIGLSGATRSISLPGLEHCIDENRQERYLDAVNGQALQLGADYAGQDKTEVRDLSEVAVGDVLVVPPQLSAAKVARSMLSTMAKQIQADKFLEETTTLEVLDLFFRPIYAFEFAWKLKNKTGVAEFDGVTGTMTNGKALHTRGDKPITRDLLFDINAETATSLMPVAAGNVKLVE
jgi:hypothetical protein